MIHYASCVFEESEFMVENYKLEQHTDRLFHSVERMGINIPFTKEE